jgi:hypothetical protein
MLILHTHIPFQWDKGSGSLRAFVVFIPKLDQSLTVKLYRKNAFFSFLFPWGKGSERSRAFAVSENLHSLTCHVPETHAKLSLEQEELNSTDFTRRPGPHTRAFVVFILSPLPSL